MYNKSTKNDTLTRQNRFRRCDDEQSYMSGFQSYLKRNENSVKADIITMQTRNQKIASYTL